MRSGVAFLVLGLAACGGSVVETPKGEGAGGGTSTNTFSTTFSETFTTGPTTTVPGGGGAGGGVVCTPVQGGSGGFMQPTCDDLKVMAVTTPLFADEGGNGKLAFGENGKVSVKLSEIAGVGFNYYPGVRFSSDTVSIPAPDDNVFYAILPCDSYQATAQIQLLENAPSGVVTYVKAQVTMLNADCPEAPSILIPVEIE